MQERESPLNLTFWIAPVALVSIVSLQL